MAFQGMAGRLQTARIIADHMKFGMSIPTESRAGWEGPPRNAAAPHGIHRADTPTGTRLPPCTTCTPRHAHSARIYTHGNAAAPHDMHYHPAPITYWHSGTTLYIISPQTTDVMYARHPPATRTHMQLEQLVSPVN